MKNLIALSAGSLFSLGLIIGGMTQVHIVRGFLDFTGEWNPRLIGVIGGAILSFALVFHLIIKKRDYSYLGEKIDLPGTNKIDSSLIIGAAIFGLGWGWVGICPGPGLSGLGSFQVEFLLFVVSMRLGMKAQSIYALKKKNQT